MKHRLVTDHAFTPEDKLFLDANIWLYLHSQLKPHGRLINTYSKVFNRIIRAKSEIYIDVLVLSEFINRYARVRQQIVAPRINFKTFRQSRNFKQVAQDVADDVKKILKDCCLIESGFTTVEMDDLLDEYAAGNSDFNDQIITKLCKSNGLTLITHDGDFRCQDISILTANRRLLRKLANS